MVFDQVHGTHQAVDIEDVALVALFPKFITVKGFEAAGFADNAGGTEQEARAVRVFEDEGVELTAGAIDFGRKCSLALANPLFEQPAVDWERSQRAAGQADQLGHRINIT